MAQNSKIISIATLFILFISGCANQLPPPGGDPDTIPPEVMAVYPPNGTTNFREKTIEIEFSEYIKRNNAREAVFISPTIEGEIEYSWSGTTLEIEFEDDLTENTTYTVTAGTDFQDENNRNNMAEPFVFAFSTGDKIDKGKIAGRVYDNKPLGIIVAAYRINDSIPNPKIDKPEYISQAGDKGDFTLLGLSPNTYRVFALRDDFKDFLYKVEQDEYGSPTHDIVLSEEDSMYVGLNFKMAREDSTLPELTSATMTDKYHLLLEFTEFIDSSKISAMNFEIIDSTSGMKFNPIHFYRGNASARQYYISFNDSLTVDEEFTLNAVNIFDYSNNRNEITSVPFIASDRPDSVKPDIPKVTTDFANNTIDFNGGSVLLNFNDGIDSSRAVGSVRFKDEHDKFYRFSTSRPDDASLKIDISEKLEPRKKYSLVLDMNKIVDAAGNVRDSVHTFELTTSSELDFSGISGKITGVIPEGKLFVIAEEARPKGEIVSVPVSEEGLYKFKQVKPGKYLVWAFGDKNGNQTYDNGSIEPFEYAEKFAYFRDTLNLRPRWPVGDVDIIFSE
ncbi:MAG: hypothetical protein SCALA702_04900 [Melioribacteraceae bacterium]|nr:MAG: hypothetical protein SCALA702_04900 [Melioribacteraceae bacterium]